MYGNWFDIRYVKIHFTIEFYEDCVVPVQKVSALRGGMGEMLLRANCVRDRNCDKCDFYDECLVQRTMYSKMIITPAFMSEGDSVGYVLECEDYHDSFCAGESMEFNLILFGKTIVYFTHFINAFFALGQEGLGKEKAYFKIVSITNSKNVPIMQGSDIIMRNYEIHTLNDYVNYRKSRLEKKGSNNQIKLKSPLLIKYKGIELDSFDINAFIQALIRRIYILNCFEGHECNILESFPSSKEDDTPIVITSDVHNISVRRYSFRKDNAMYMKGIEGLVQLDKIPSDYIDVLLAGELIHIGKNTSFGFGRYRFG